MPYVDSQRCTPQRYFKAEMSPLAVIHSHQQHVSRQNADADILRVIGFLQLQHGKFEQAVAVFDALHALFPEDFTIGLSLALSLLKLGHADQAAQVLERIESGFDFSGEQSSFQKNPCFCWLRSQTLSATGDAIEAARWMRFFIRLRRQSNLQATL
jgi:hypothetical protein